MTTSGGSPFAVDPQQAQWAVDYEVIGSPPHGGRGRRVGSVETCAPNAEQAERQALRWAYAHDPRCHSHGTPQADTAAENTAGAGKRVVEELCAGGPPPVTPVVPVVRVIGVEHVDGPLR